MTMRERIAEGKLFTDHCEGLPSDRLKAKKLMKKLNDSDPENMQESVNYQNHFRRKLRSIYRTAHIFLLRL